MRGRPKKPQIKLTKPEVKPVLNETRKEDNKSKLIRIYGVYYSDYLVGYYDYSLRSFVAYKQKWSNAKAKLKLEEKEIIGWQYV